MTETQLIKEYTQKGRLAELATLRDVICDLCGDEQTATRPELHIAGWEITPKHAFCPMHKDEV